MNIIEDLISCFFIFILLIVFGCAHGDIEAYSEREIQIPMSLNIIWFISNFILLPGLLYITRDRPSGAPIEYLITVLFVCICRRFALLKFIAQFYVYKQDAFRSKLAECYKIEEERLWHKKYRNIHCHITFKNDSEKYEIGLGKYEEMQFTIGKEYIYKKCYCKYGLIVLKDLELNK